MSNINVLANLNIKSKSSIIIENSDQYPETPEIGQLVFVNKFLSIYSDVNGTPAWYPLFYANASAYVHTQESPSMQWVINHNLNSENIIYFVYNSENTVMYSSDIEFNIDNNSFTLDFTEAVDGKCIVFSSDSNFASVSTSGSTESSYFSITSYFNDLSISNITYNEDDTMDTITYTAGNKKIYTYNENSEPTKIEYLDVDGVTVLKTNNYYYDVDGKLSSTDWV